MDRDHCMADPAAKLVPHDGRARIRHRHRAHDGRPGRRRAALVRERQRRQQGLGRAGAGDPGPARRGRPAPRRSRRDRLRPRPGRLHRPAHRLLGGPGPGLRRRQAGAADRQPAGRRRGGARPGAATFRTWAAMDARMDQIYAAEYRFADGRWTTLAAPMLVDCAELALRWREAPPEAVAGDALAAFGDRLDTGAARASPRRAPMPRRCSPWRAAPGATAAASTPPRRCRCTCATRWRRPTRERDAARAAAGGGRMSANPRPPARCDRRPHPPADDARVARRRGRARDRGLCLPLDPRQLRRLARRRLHRLDAQRQRRRAARLLRGDARRRRDAPAQHHRRPGGAPPGPRAPPARCADRTSAATSTPSASGSRCAIGNVDAQRTYLRLGFTKVGVRKGYYPAPAGTREDAVVMSRIIEPAAGGADALE